MPVKLYAVPASHPCAAVERALRHRGLGYRRVDLPHGAHFAHQRLRFGVHTVPGLIGDPTDLAALPGCRDRVDGWIADGVVLAGRPSLQRAL